ncbi:hypothetical protein [Sphingomonas sp.]|jgi:hypothetical protein|uniref:hypothetical protein n=1 Tax=Sphingomonas sp. TaxID=28214 RepID=UPI002DF1B782|nr:hypothetical protein [Sphingomonas sp.]
MRLIVHAGLHKTGSTYLQHIMNDHHAELRAAGVWYERQDGYPAHHFAAWAMLRGDMAPLERMIREAAQSGCGTVILSSEDLEGALFDGVTAAGIERAAAAMGVESVEWHVCLRDPGEAFSSLYAQLQYHVFADPASMLWEVLRDGMLMIIDPLRGAPGTPFWCFAFDHERYLGAFEDQHELIAHDFRDTDPFPGWGVLDAAGVLDVVHRLPGADARNARLGPDQVRAAYAEQILQWLPDAHHRAALQPVLDQQLELHAAAVPAYAALVSARFAPSMEAAMARFGAGQQPLRAVA